jgi:isopenicillin-N epimerase
MATVRLPLKDSSPKALAAFKTRLYEEYRVEAPLIAWNGQVLLRISVQGYNTQEDVDALVSALKALL